MLLFIFFYVGGKNKEIYSYLLDYTSFQVILLGAEVGKPWHPWDELQGTITDPLKISIHLFF